MDGNVERVVSRIFKIEGLLPKARPEHRKLAGTIAPQNRPGDYGQALMDLGATICTPRSPKCQVCPWQSFCVAFRDGTQIQYPKKAKKEKLPVRYGAAFVLMSGEKVLLRKRPEKGLLGGMMEFPGTEWGEKPSNPMASAPLNRNWEKCEGEVKHIFTHFELRLDVYRGGVANSVAEGVWARLSDIADYALPTVMKKVLSLSQK